MPIFHRSVFLCTALRRNPFFFRFSCRSLLCFRSPLLRQPFFFFLLLFCLFDPAADLLQYLLCIIQPLDGPDAHRPPAEPRKNGRLHRKTVCCGLVTAHVFTVQKDPQQIVFFLLRIHDAHIQTVFRTAHVRAHFIAEPAHLCSDLTHHRILMHCLRTALRRDHPLSVLCKFQKALQSGHTLGSGTADVDLLRPQYGIYDHLFSCTGNRHVQPAPAAVAV